MTIDKITTNLYTCCGCKYQLTGWTGNGSGNVNHSEGGHVTKTMYLPKCCPRCASIRWNQRCLDDELTLIDRLQDELYETDLIKESGDQVCS